MLLSLEAVVAHLIFVALIITISLYGEIRKR